MADSCECQHEFRVFHKMQGTSCLDEGLVASQERLFHVVILKFKSELGPYKLSVWLWVLGVFRKFHATILTEVMIQSYTLKFVLTTTDTFLPNHQISPRDTHTHTNTVPLEVMKSKPTPVVAPIRPASMRNINVSVSSNGQCLRKNHSGAHTTNN
jgi:hypothetical protein